MKANTPEYPETFQRTELASSKRQTSPKLSKEKHSIINAVEILYLTIALTHSLLFGRLCWAVMKGQVPKGVETAEATILIIATLVFCFDNLVIASGRTIGNGTTLELLSRVRYFGYAMISPWLLFLLGNVHCHEESEMETNFCAGIDAGFATPLSICLFALTVVREFMGSTLTLTPDDVGACLASESFLSKVYFVPDSKSNQTLVYRPMKKRSGFGIAFSLSVFYSIYRGLHDEFDTNPSSSTAHRWLLLGGMAMVLFSVGSKLVIGTEELNLSQARKQTKFVDEYLEAPDREVRILGFQFRDKEVTNISQRLGECLWFATLVAFFLSV